MTDRLSYADRVCIEVTVRAARGFVFYAYQHMEPIATQIMEDAIQESQSKSPVPPFLHSRQLHRNTRKWL